MATSGQYVVIGVFDDLASADRSLMALREAGFRQDQIRYTAGEGTEKGTHKGIKSLFSGEKTVPHKDIMGDLVNMGVDPQDARVYQREYETGHPLISVAGTGNMQKAITILHKEGAHAPADLAGRETRSQTTSRSADMAGSRPGEAGVVDTATTRDTTASRTDEVLSANAPESQKIRLHAERLKAYKQPEQIGEVDIRKEVVTEQQTFNVPVTREEVVIERHSLAEDASAAENPIGEDETIRIPIRGEKVNVTKETVTTGEVEISKREVQEDRQFSETVRHEEAHLENKGDVPIIDSERDQPPAQPQM